MATFSLRKGPLFDVVPRIVPEIGYRLRFQHFTLTGNKYGGAYMYVGSGRHFAGSITRNGELHLKVPEDATLAERAAAREELKRLATNPIETIQQVGIETGICCLCGRELTDPESIARGVGSICASKLFT